MPKFEPRQAIHTIYFGPKNLHGTRVTGTVVSRKQPDSDHPYSRYLFTDGRSQHWVKESSVELI